MSDEDVARNAALMGLEMPPEQLARVAELLRRIEDIAQKLAAAPLDPLTDEQAPVWRP